MFKHLFARNGWVATLAISGLWLMFALLGTTPSRSVVAASQATFTVNNTSDAIDVAPGNGVCQTSTAGQCTLRAAIMEANALPGADTIVVPAGTYNLIRPGNDDTAINGDLDITASLTISGAGYANTIIDGVGFMTPDRIFHITGTVDVAIKGVTLMRGKPQADNHNGAGGSLYNYNGRVTLTGVRVYTNTAYSVGGGIVSLGSTHALTLAQSILEGNVGAYGGGLYMEGAPLTLIGTQLQDNQAIGGFLTAGLGGGAYVDNSTRPTEMISITDGLTARNVAYEGGGWYISRAPLKLSGMQLISNTATGDFGYGGGALHFTSSAQGQTRAEIDHAQFLSNTAHLGGGIYLDYSTDMTLAQTMLQGNLAEQGGGLYVSGQLTGTHVVITGNQAEWRGGGLDTYGRVRLIDSTLSRNYAITSTFANGGGVSVGNGQLDMQGGSIDHNVSTYGGGVSVAGGGVVTLTAVTVGNNAATTGGGLFVSGASLTMNGGALSVNSAGAMGGGAAISTTGYLTVTGVQIAENYTFNQGGGLHIDGGSLSMERSTVSKNYAVAGGGVYFKNSASHIANSTLTGNYATSRGGGVYQGIGQAALIEQSTIAYNHALDLNFFNADAGGVYVVPTGTLGLRNTLVANNSANDVSQDCAGPITSQDYNFIEVTTGCTVSGITTHNITSVDPKLGALADNGGGTLTHALLAGSPARDKIPANLCPATDQRGVKRPQGAACDIGAFEAELKLYLPLTLR